MLNGYDYDLLSNEAKHKILYKLTRFIVGIKEAKILIVPVKQNIEEHFSRLKDNISKTDPLYEYASNYADKTYEYLQETIKSSGLINDYRAYIVVKLADENEIDFLSRFKDFSDYFFKDVVNAVNVYMNLDKRDILQSRVDYFEKQSKKFFKEQKARLELEPVSVSTVQWLLKRMSYRSLNKDVSLFYKSQEKEWLPDSSDIKFEKDTIIKPYTRDISNIFSGVIRKGKRMLEIDNDEDGISYQTFLVITNLPDEIVFPGSEWLYMLQKYNSQTEVCIHIKNLEFNKSMDSVSKKRREVTEQMRHIEEANAEIPEELFESKQDISLLDGELRHGKYPTVRTSITICVSDVDPEALDLRARKIKQEFEDLNFSVERPLTDQLNLYMQFIPSIGFSTKDFVLKLTPMCLAGGVFGATRQLGDYVGPYIGTTGVEKKLVFLSLGQACLQNKSAVTTFFGNLGQGKSFNLNLISLLNVIYGGYALIIDPKSERTHWPEKLTMLDGMISLVTLSSENKFKGALDPFNIYRGDIEEACDLALNILMEFFNINISDDEYTALLVAFREIKKVELPSMMALSTILAGFDKTDTLCGIASSLARKISLQKDTGLSKLLFGDGSEKAITLKNRLNILQIDGLKLPHADISRENYSREEKVGTVLMMVMCSFARNFIWNEDLKGKFKILAIDESYVLSKTSEGAKLIDETSRQSRSLYTAIILNGHSVLDLPTEGTVNAVTYKFCFHTDNVKEAERMLKYMNLEVTPNNIAIVQNLNNGQCLFQDLDKHVGILNFDAVFGDIVEIFSTTPKPKKDTILTVSEEEIITEEGAYETIEETFEDIATTIQEEDFSFEEDFEDEQELDTLFNEDYKVPLEPTTFTKKTTIDIYSYEKCYGGE